MSRMDETGSYSLGVILSKMMKATEFEKIQRCLEEQKSMSEEEVLGQILVAKGLITQDQLLVALEAQRGLRSKKKHERAMAMTRLAECSGQNVVELAQHVKRASAENKRRLTTGTGYPAVRPGMYMKLNAAKGGEEEP